MPFGEIVHIDCDGRVELFAAQNRAATGSFRPFGGATSLDDELYLVFDLDPPSTPLTPWPQGELTLRLNVAGSAAVGELAASLLRRNSRRAARDLQAEATDSDRICSRDDQVGQRWTPPPCSARVPSKVPP